MWIPFPRRLHRARYDENGNIILPSDEPSAAQPAAQKAEPQKVEGVSEAWAIVEPPSTEEIFENGIDCTTQEHSQDHRTNDPLKLGEKLSAVRRNISVHVLEEGLRQYRESIRDAKPMLTDMAEESAGILRRVGRFLAQPVWVPGRGKKLKQHNRGMLFFIDIVRFGGTFAAIFVALFITLNYESFWQITTAHLSPFIPAISGTSGDTDAALREQLKLLPALAEAGGTPGDLLSYLPEVGPPDNLLMIPKLNMSAPIVDPSYDALLKGDWPQVEKDIQASLVDGVVHYPGTAKPGQAGNFFVTGHSSYYPWAPGKYKTVFARLQDLQIGDEYWVYFGGDKHRYVIRTKKEVSPSDITVLDQPTDERISTLMTCTPVGTTLRRLILVSDEVDPTTGAPLKVGQQPAQSAPKVNLDALPI